MLYSKHLTQTQKKKYWELKDSMANNNIEGPVEIENYLLLTMELIENNQYSNDTSELIKMVDLYTEELRVLGITDEYIKKL